MDWLCLQYLSKTFKLCCSGYMAPEYYSHGKISPKADIFSLGVIMIYSQEVGSIPKARHIIPTPLMTIYNTLDSTQANLQQFTGNVSWINYGLSTIVICFVYAPLSYATVQVLGKWKKIFQRTLHEASVIQVYTHQLKQLIDIALKCVDIDVNKRPTAADILQFFYQNAAGGSSCDPICKNSQV